jgi:flagellar biosynthetic protein FlhB
MAGDKDGKTEKPTQKKLRDARKEGQFPRTPDASTWTAIAAGAALIPKSVSVTAGQARQLLARLPDVAMDPTPARALAVLDAMPLAILKSAAPVCLAALLGGLLATMAQGVYPSSKVMKPKFSRMNPKEGIKRMFGTRSLWEALKSVAKVAVIATVVWVLGKHLVPELAGSGTLPLSATVQRAQKGLQTMIWSAAAAGLVLAVADYAYQRHTVMKQLMMTPKEIKDEFKQTEGDPMLKGAIRAKQLAISRNRMLAKVPEANVVLVNPTHLSIALKYRAGQGAPRVVAKGAGSVALKIREIARDNRIPVVEDKPLARAIYRVCELDEEIPSELYMAVARILAFVMAAGKPGRHAGPRRPTYKTPVPEDLPTKAVLRARRAREIRGAKHL